ncbi:uncharacterized protein EV154DRAFT_565178 [Mucor mucedo]|uniref:uncharacterized protein n=1 Tax=Mucor mucedo TaxID=29922 RepID=UPI0022200F81|nr:uncharacterized protein EV154DRAFT_565178 [Mucor mucedo]KAI7889622.1 hypothetical protein EV154DRAFT_565178 [Mucor mucedo]
MPLIAKNQDHSFHVKHITTGKKRAWDNSGISTNVNPTKNIEADLMSILHYGPYAEQLSKRCFKQLDISSCQLLNEDWTFLPQLRFACAQLKKLASWQAIKMQTSRASSIFANDLRHLSNVC